MRQVTASDQGNGRFPTWSPDGQWIAYHNSCGLWIIRPDGSDARDLSPLPGEYCAYEMVWSPDSQQIAFLNASDEPLFDVWVINHDGSDPRRVCAFEQPLDWVNVAWSPEGRRVACMYVEDGVEKSLIAPIGGGGEPQLIVGEDEQPWWWFPYFWPP